MELWGFLGGFGGYVRLSCSLVIEACWSWPSSVAKNCDKFKLIKALLKLHLTLQCRLDLEDSSGKRNSKRKAGFVWSPKMHLCLTAFLASLLFFEGKASPPVSWACPNLERGRVRELVSNEQRAMSAPSYWQMRETSLPSSGIIILQVYYSVHIQDLQ